MKRWPDSSSPWRHRLWFDSHEFEGTMDAWRARAGVTALVPGRGVDVDRVLQSAVPGQCIEADYVELPDGVLGRTCFRRDGAIRIEVARDLADLAEVDSVARRRLRSTLAHEGGHVACHRELFPRDAETLPLFPEEDAPPAPPMLCRHEVIAQPSYDGAWWEFQANQCMAAMLLPRALVGASVRVMLSDRKLETFGHALARGVAEDLLRAVAHEYDVSLRLALHRMEALGFIPSRWQSKIALST